MLNIGLIGKSDSLELQIKELNTYDGIAIQGKSSVGTKDLDSDYSYTIPEYNRVELLERSDALILDDHTLLPYELIKDAIKRNKHIFFADYPEYSNLQFEELVKLIDESGTIVQVKNPYMYNPAVNWIRKKLSTPFYMDIDLKLDFNNKNEIPLIELIIMLLKVSTLELKKVKPLYFKNEVKEYRYNNIRFEFDNSSVVNLKILKWDKDRKFTIHTITNNEIINANILKPSVDSTTGYSSLKGLKFSNEFESFFSAIKRQSFPKTGMRDYFEAKKATDEIINNVTFPTS